jgi:hypothetical protein
MRRYHRNSPDRILGQAARILAADPAMWRVLLARMGGRARIPVVLNEQLKPKPGRPMYVAVEIWDGHAVFLEMPPQPGESADSVGRRYGNVLAMLEQSEGFARLFTWSPYAEMYRHVLRLWPGEYDVDEEP